MKDLANELANQHSEPKSQFSLKYVAPKWHSPNKINYLKIEWTDFKNLIRVGDLREENFLRDAGSHETA